MRKQTGNTKLSLEDKGMRDLKLMTFVRDPIDHFLSGWAECGERKQLPAGDNPKASYDTRIQKWLQQTKTDYETKTGSCSVHSLPQANFLLDGEGNVHPGLELIGDLEEMVGVLEAVDFQHNPKIGKRRESAKNEVKSQSFPPRKDLISKKTMRNLCQFLAVDYFLFDYVPPKACKGVV